jgi:regulator of sigma E protease
MFVITLIVFLIILGLLIFVHEAGHFAAAKLSGVKVDEFAFGFPPRILGFQIRGRKKNQETKITQQIKIEIDDKKTGGGEKITETVTESVETEEKISRRYRWYFGWGGKGLEKAVGEKEVNESTVYAINLFPIGGYVKMLGEDEISQSPRSFSKKKARFRLLIVVAGVLMNFLLGGILLSIGYGIGMSPISVNENEFTHGKINQVVIAKVNDDSPAAMSGIKRGDVIEGFADIEQFSAFTKANLNKTIDLNIVRDDKPTQISVTVSGNQDAPIGVGLMDIAKIKLPFFSAIYYGFKDMALTSKNVVLALYLIVVGLFKTGKIGEAVSGPVGIFNVTGQAVQLGFIYILQLAALLSINLAIINIIPFPGLDGSRALIIGLEGIARKKVIKSEIESYLHMIGFVILILLILLVTFKDIVALI